MATSSPSALPAFRSSRPSGDSPARSRPADVRNVRRETAVSRRMAMLVQYRPVGRAVVVHVELVIRAVPVERAFQGRMRRGASGFIRNERPGVPRLVYDLAEPDLERVDLGPFAGDALGVCFEAHAGTTAT